jgi:SAM-dependent methyltransferase
VIDRERRRLSFGSVAALHERYRPGYPAEAVAWLLGPGPLRVLDLGAGTGKLTRAVLAAGHDVVAVEPDAEMRAELAARLPGVSLHAGSAEQIPLPDASVDAVTLGQAFHWIDRGGALPEIARVLRPGGVLAVTWNLRDESVAWAAELTAATDGGDSTRDAREEIDSFGDAFDPVEHARFAHVFPVDVDGLAGLVASWSYTITRPADERERILEDVQALGRRVAAPDGTIAVPFVTVCLRARRA